MCRLSELAALKRFLPKKSVAGRCATYMAFQAWGARPSDAEREVDAVIAAEECRTKPVRAYDEMPRALGRGAISPNQIQPK